MTPIRLARFLARAGVVSRRGAAELVATGRVRVNGDRPRGPGDPVEPDADRVTVDGRPVTMAAAACLALHKPTGYVTSRADSRRFKSVFSLFGGVSDALVAVGRLDVMSEGLLLFTTDGELAARLMHPRWAVPRTYRVSVAGVLGPAQRAALDAGVNVGEGPPARPTRWRFTAKRGGGILEVELAEGRNRVVRRMCATLGLTVRTLTRTGYGPIRLGALAAGRSRPLTAAELAAIYRSVDLPRPAAHD